MILYIYPAVRVAAIIAGQDAGVVEMADPDVIRRQSKPGAVRLRDVGGQLVAYPYDIARTTSDALCRVNAVGHAHELGGGQSQHHQAAYTGRRAGIHIPQ